MEKNKIIEEQQTIYKKICPYCNTGIISMYPKQLEFNYKVHLDTCKERKVESK